MTADPNYSLSAVWRSLATETWAFVMSRERRAHLDLCEKAGGEPTQGNAARIPGYALRDLNAASPSGGGYLVPTSVGAVLPYLVEDSLLLRFGARPVPVASGSSIAMPYVSTAPAGGWQVSETGAATAQDIGLGGINAVPKFFIAVVSISRQLLTQAANTETVARETLRRVAAVALDTAALAGSGVSGQPLGVINTSGVGAFTGASMDISALRDAQKDLIASRAITNPSALAYVAGSDVADLLSKRQRFTGSDRGLWEGSSFEGVVEGVRAGATANMPAATMVLGDFSQLWLLEFGVGLEISLNPYANFQTGSVSLRVVLQADVVLARRAAFTVATSVS